MSNSNTIWDKLLLWSFFIIATVPISTCTTFKVYEAINGPSDFKKSVLIEDVFEYSKYSSFIKDVVGCELLLVIYNQYNPEPSYKLFKCPVALDTPTIKKYKKYLVRNSKTLPVIWTAKGFSIENPHSEDFYPKWAVGTNWILYEH